MRTYQTLSHIADIRLRVEADNLSELFVAAIEGMNSILKAQSVKRKAQNKIIVGIQALDVTALLIDFMNEVLYQSQTNKEIYMEVKFLEFPFFAEASSDAEILADMSAGKSKTALKAEIYGQKVEEFDEDIKAVTYHEAEIVKNEKGNYETMIVFDI